MQEYQWGDTPQIMVYKIPRSLPERCTERVKESGTVEWKVNITMGY